MTKNIILGVTGSIAAFKAAIIVSKLKSLGFDITVVMTQSSQNFIPPTDVQNAFTKQGSYRYFY